ncbi:hypothetical protein B0T24DRAFT_337474 [Lasiosphaeria ovina]|uniref:Secreted protein n=1 Tax=Lasiosphaeria ovina TaxID=92902 RepID=A0AAE0K8D4_9PEZI|nr:hypothetical protein B0T24DRAFT_337474 [Lasiosphaeria ovina]
MRTFAIFIVIFIYRILWPLCSSPWRSTQVEFSASKGAIGVETSLACGPGDLPISTLDTMLTMALIVMEVRLVEIV